MIPVAWSEARNTAAFATSSAVAILSSAVPEPRAARACGRRRAADALAVVEPLEQGLGRDRARGEPVDANTVGAKIERRGTDDAERGVLRGGVEHLAGSGAEGIDRAHHDDRTAALPHGRCGVLQRRGYSANVDGEDPVPFRHVERTRLAPWRHQTGIGNDDVEAAETSRHLGDGGSEVGFVGHVGGSMEETRRGVDVPNAAGRSRRAPVAPAAAKASPMARPNPRAPPVIIATRPERSPLMTLLSSPDEAR